MSIGILTLWSLAFCNVSVCLKIELLQSEVRATLTVGVRISYLNAVMNYTGFGKWP